MSLILSNFIAALDNKNVHEFYLNFGQSESFWDNFCFIHNLMKEKERFLNKTNYPCSSGIKIKLPVV